MTDKVLQLPDRFRDPYSFESVLNEALPLAASGGKLDMRNVRFIEPYALLSFLLIGKDYLKSRGEKLILTGIPVAVHQYLSRMDFFGYGYFAVESKLDERLQLKRSSFSKSVIEITEIPGKERDSIAAISSIISLFRKRADFLLKYWVADHISEYYITVISELCQNIFEHSLDSGFLAMQTYSHERENIVQLSIVDSGIGIRKSFENSGLHFSSTSELIKQAFTTQISSKRKFGHGLCQVNSIAERFSGDLFIRSGDGLAASLKRNKKSSSVFFLKDDLVNFQGTQISLSLSSPRN